MPLWTQAQASVLQKRRGGLSRVLPARPPRPVCAPYVRFSRPAGAAGRWTLACSIRMEAEPPPSAWPRPPKKPEQVKEARSRPASRGRRGPCRNKGSRPGAGKWGAAPGGRWGGGGSPPRALRSPNPPAARGLTQGSPAPWEGTGGGDLVSFPRWFPRAARSRASVPGSPTGFPAAQRGRPGVLRGGDPRPAWAQPPRPAPSRGAGPPARAARPPATPCGDLIPGSRRAACLPRPGPCRLLRLHTRRGRPRP